MAKSQTFGKRENEKKKQAKRFEKQKRREERQAGGSSSLDDMIAYVDENGNITDTPTEKYFFHISSAPEGIGEGRIVLFELMRGTRGMNAVKIAFAQ